MKYEHKQKYLGLELTFVIHVEMNLGPNIVLNTYTIISNLKGVYCHPKCLLPNSHTNYK